MIDKGWACEYLDHDMIVLGMAGDHGYCKRCGYKWSYDWRAEIEEEENEEED